MAMDLRRVPEVRWGGVELGNLPDGVSLAEGMEWGCRFAFTCPELSWRLSALSLGCEPSVYLQQGQGW